MRTSEKRAKIRYAQMNNYKIIFELLAELGRDSPKDQYEYQKFKSHIEDYIDSKDHNQAILVATIGSEIVGLLSYVMLYRLNQRFREFWIPELVVSKEYRNQGIGKLLIHKCESIARKKHCYRMRLESGTDRIQSHRFYKKIGFKRTALTFAKRI
jgi:GNAT superfamily N-acetyltransferase